MCFASSETIDELEDKHPGIFGPKKGYSRALSISSMGWTLGMFIGPILSGNLIERVGYFATNSAMGEFLVFWKRFYVDIDWLLTYLLAVLCLLCGAGAFFCLKSKPKKTNDANPNC